MTDASLHTIQPNTPATPTPSPAPARDGAPTLSETDRRALAAIQARNPEADPLRHLPGVPPSRVPRHVAIIMDGNGRWAQERGFPRIFGHRNGAASVRTVVEAAGRMGVEVLTLYSFSLENWKRPPEEVEALMALCEAYLEGNRDLLLRNGVRFRVIGRREGLPEPVRKGVAMLEELTSDCTRATLCLALNYGSRSEIADAARCIAERVRAGELDPADVNESTVAAHLYAPDLPDPDLLIRTAGELRVSNYLLWQISYAELYVTETYWPDFREAALRQAITAYAARDRRFGGLNTPTA
ncbi:MAG: di-trans,poly-cis-decaprenylcistransferase [Phycisphaerales bacterium]|nr:MAG: di-trans,poly-cis-decaprenylcistransferase [Phycisphaerales bacterium]